MHYVKDPEEALGNAHICFVFTEWNQIKELKAERFKALMQTPLVYDGRNVFDKKEMADNQVEYYSMGR